MIRTVIFILCCACSIQAAAPAKSYLFVWAGDSDKKAHDFIGVIDADPASPHYGSIVASLPTDSVGAHPHHTEAVMPAGGRLLANGFHAGRTWLFDLRQPLHPTIVTSFGDVAGLSHPHTFVRLKNGNILSTFQYKASADGIAHDHASMGMGMDSPVKHTTGGLVEMTERGRLIRSGSGVDASIQDKELFPYSVLPLESANRAVSTTTDMDDENKAATSEWVQFWRLSDLKLLRSIALKPGPRGDENKYSGEPMLLPDGHSVYIHTFSCGLYLVKDAAGDSPTATMVHSFPGGQCGVPILAGHYWLQPVPKTHSLVSLDITDPEHPREVSSVSFGDDEEPHWTSMDRTGRRVVLNSAGAGTGNRLFIINFDPATGALAIDNRFRDAGSDHAGISMTGKQWPHGFAGKAIPHGTVFSR